MNTNFDFCTLYVQEGGGFQEFLEFSGSSTGGGQCENLMAETLLAESGQHVGKRRRGFRCVPRPDKRTAMAMTFTREPQHDQAIEQHGQRGGSFDRAPRPPLRFLESQMLLGVVVRHL